MTERLEVRLTPEDSRRLRALAEIAQRSQADVVRLLVRSVTPAYLSAGINLPEVRGEARETALAQPAA